MQAGNLFCRWRYFIAPFILASPWQNVSALFLEALFWALLHTKQEPSGEGSLFTWALHGSWNWEVTLEICTTDKKYCKPVSRFLYFNASTKAAIIYLLPALLQDCICLPTPHRAS